MGNGPSTPSKQEGQASVPKAAQAVTEIPKGSFSLSEIANTKGENGKTNHENWKDIIAKMPTPRHEPSAGVRSLIDQVHNQTKEEFKASQPNNPGQGR